MPFLPPNQQRQSTEGTHGWTQGDKSNNTATVWHFHPNTHWRLSRKHNNKNTISWLCKEKCGAFPQLHGQRVNCRCSHNFVHLVKKSNNNCTEHSSKRSSGREILTHLVEPVRPRLAVLTNKLRNHLITAWRHCSTYTPHTNTNCSFHCQPGSGWLTVYVKSHYYYYYYNHLMASFPGQPG